jgi:AcrR family transcriptional regulator
MSQFAASLACLAVGAAGAVGQFYAMVNLETGHVKHKARTREKLMRIAFAMIRAGRIPTVTAVADEAGIARATAYRYFATPESLLLEALIAFQGTPYETPLYEFLETESDLEARLDAVVVANQARIAEHLREARALLWLSLRPGAAGSRFVRPRPQYRRKWFIEALHDVKDQIGGDEFSRLISALCLCVGLESNLVLRDICHLSKSEAEGVERWAARALVRAALDESGVRPAARRTSRPRRKGSVGRTRSIKAR